MSVTYFSVFSPEPFQVELKNKFLLERKKLFRLNPQKNLSPSHQLTTENSSINKTKTTYYRTTVNFNTNTNYENIRDLISTKRILKLKKFKKNPKNILSQALKEKVQPYKQYILEKRELENMKKEKSRYKYMLRNKKDLLALPDKSKIKGVYFSKQKGFGFLDQYLESKNYSKGKISNTYRRPAFMIRRNKYDDFDLSILDDITSNKRKNVFEENFGVKSYSRYDKLRQNAMSFLKYLNNDPNYNF